MEVKQVNRERYYVMLQRDELELLMKLAAVNLENPAETLRKLIVNALQEKNDDKTKAQRPVR